MKSIFKFGENVEGYDIPVLNEREIRASAGILFVVMFFSLMLIIFKGQFLMIKYVIVLFLTDFLIRVFLNPRFSPTLIMGRLIVSGQNPEYVGAAQKRFAWIIGIALAVIMLTFMVIVNSYSPITGIICLICLLFLFFESAFGICLGCLFYGFFYRDKAKYCPGEICDTRTKHNIQKTSWMQLLILIAFIGYAVLAVYLFNDRFSVAPFDLFGLSDSLPQPQN